MNRKPTVGIVIPVLNEAERLEHTLEKLGRHNVHEIVVVDGGSRDDSKSVVEDRIRSQTNIKLVGSDPGRAKQMNTGAREIYAEVICFLHADTTLPNDAVELIREASKANQQWGRFDVRFAETHILLRLVAWSMNWRSALTGICTGDQCIWVEQKLFEEIGGYPDIPLMEDIELCKRLKKLAHPCRIKMPVTTSARRWLNHGLVRTILLMWWLRFLYWLGVPAQRLATWYR